METRLDFFVNSTEDELEEDEDYFYIPSLLGSARQERGPQPSGDS